MKLTIAYWLWRDDSRLIPSVRNGKAKPRIYTSAHVNAQLPMLERWGKGCDYEVVCICDDASAEGLDARIRRVPMPVIDIDAYEQADFELSIPCTRKLWTFSKEARELVGERVLCLDIDTIIVGPMKPVFARTEPLVVIGQFGRVYGGAWLVEPGAYPIWEKWLAETNKTKYTDQTFITDFFGRGNDCDALPHFGPEVDVLGAHDHPQPGASILTINMYFKPWEKEAEEYFPWMRGVHPMAFGEHDARLA